MPSDTAPFPYVDKQTRVIGYVRVSTQDQASDLDKQAARIRDECDRRGLTPIMIYEDVGSAMHPDALARDGLRGALDHARREQLPLVVTHRSRVSRLADGPERIAREHGVWIVCIDAGFAPVSAVPTPAGMRDQRFAERVADRTRKALDGRKAKRGALGNPNLAAARRSAAIAKIVKRDDLVRKIVRILRLKDPTGRLPARAVVDILNDEGLLSGTERHWTMGSIRRPLRAAREQILLENEASDELETKGFS